LNKRKAERALRKLAERERVTVGFIRAKIQEAIDIGMSNPDPDIQRFWKSIPHQGDRPTPEDVICFMGERVTTK
jgi:hypothetical protein